MLDLDSLKKTPTLTIPTSSSSTTPIPPKNQFTALLCSGLIKDMLCAFSDERNTFWAFAELGENVCGHPR